MHWLTLPDPRKNIVPAFQDVAGARAWLAQQPQAHPSQTLAALAMQVEAIDASAVAPALAIELLGLLRTAAVPLQDAIEPRYTRKALPLPEDDFRAFELAARFWLRLGVAYLRRHDELAPAERGLALNRAACALRLAAYCHFLAAYECPQAINRLLFGTLAQASRDGLLEQALPDRDFPHLGDSTVAGHLAWAFLLRLVDPYRLTGAQLTVANRAISRWRELAPFRAAPDDDPAARELDLAPLYGGALPAEVPRWLGIRSVDRKLRRRLESLRQGEAPEALKLGRELSGDACIRLLEELRHSLGAHEHEPSTEIGEIALAFGGEDAYALLRGEYLNPAANLGSGGALAHQRMALFGFDRLSQMPTAVKRIQVATESWTLLDGMVIRPAAGPDSVRRISPCLVAASHHGRPQLGVLFGLQVGTDNVLSGGLHWYDGAIEAGWLKRPELREQAAPR
ncbi:MAG TPA: hypothetical protein VF096_09605, partial [Azonexus sp.]